MKINPEIEEILKKFNIDINCGVLVLLAIYHNIELAEKVVVAHDAWHQINLTKIVERDYPNGTIRWNVPLYLGENPEEDKQWDWILEWRKMFGAIRSDAIGSRSSCYVKMKKYFAEHPDVRKEEILKATQMYINSVTNPKYLQKADYFISKVVEGSKGSRLDMYIEILRDSTTTTDEVAKRNLGRIAQ